MNQSPDHKILLERYEVGEVIGRGGMGEVRAARDLTLDRPVAIKFLRSHIEPDAEMKARFDSEAKAAARLIHPNIVAVFDSGDDEGFPFIVMERLSGRTLADRVAEGLLEETEVRHLGLQILAALEASHEAGILHRDLKPGNIMLTDSGVAKVADFGIAKAVEGIDMTTTGMTMGTPAYLAPERVAGEPATEVSDVYSAGVVLYELITGNKPFRADTPLGLARAIQEDEPEPLRQARPEVDLALATIVEKAMAKTPGKRFSSAERMRRDLEDWVPRSELESTGALSGSSTRRLRTGKKRPSRFVRRLAGFVIGILAITWTAYVLTSVDRSAPEQIQRSPSVAASPTPTIPLVPPLQEALGQLDAAIAETGTSEALQLGVEQLRSAVQTGDRLAVSDQLRMLREAVQLLGQQGTLPGSAVERLMGALFGVDLQLGMIAPPSPTVLPPGAPSG